MPSSLNAHRRSWQEIIDAVSRESDPKRLRELAIELDRALEERDRSLGLQHRLNHAQLRVRAEEVLAETRSAIQQLRISRSDKAELERRALANWAECVDCAPNAKTQGKNQRT